MCVVREPRTGGDRSVVGRTTSDGSAVDRRGARQSTAPRSDRQPVAAAGEQLSLAGGLVLLLRTSFDAVQFLVVDGRRPDFFRRGNRRDVHR